MKPHFFGKPMALINVPSSYAEPAELRDGK